MHAVQVTVLNGFSAIKSETLASTRYKYVLYTLKQMVQSSFLHTRSVLAIHIVAYSSRKK
jgi:hypothetical protein